MISSSTVELTPNSHTVFPAKVSPIHRSSK